MTIDVKPNTVLMPGLYCFPNDELCKFLAVFQQASVGLFWASFNFFLTEFSSHVQIYFIFMYVYL